MAIITHMRLIDFFIVPLVGFVICLELQTNSLADLKTMYIIPRTPSRENSPESTTTATNVMGVKPENLEAMSREELINVVRQVCTLNIIVDSKLTYADDE
jgi:hypothetical protein